MDGTGELIGEVPIRVHLITGGAQGSIQSVGYYRVPGGGTVRAIGTPEEDDFTRHDTDAFEVGSDTYASGSADWTGDGAVYTRHALRTLEPGLLDFEQVVEILVDGSGSLPSGHALRLYRLRGTTLTLLDDGPQAVLTGVNETRGLAARWRGLVETDDTFFPMFFYPAGGTLSLGDVDVVNFRRAATLQPDISRTYTP